MSLTAAMIRALGEEGLDVDAIARVAERLDAVAAQELEAKRSAKRAGNAERQRRFKANRKAVTVTANNAGNAGNAVTPSPNEYISNPLPATQVISSEITPPSDFDLISVEEEPAQLREEHVVEAWNAVAEECDLPKARLTPQRKRKLKPFIRQHTIDDIATALDAVRRSPFMRGQNDRGWRADFDFFTKPEKFNRLVEGTYGS